MFYKFGRNVVLGLGGSILFNSKFELDLQLIKEFKSFIEKEKNKRRKIFIVVGGGKLARTFQDSAQKVCKISDKEKDWIGIYATRLNAVLIKSVLGFSSVIYPSIIESEEKLEEISRKSPKQKIFVVSGWKPGYSTDFVSAVTAFKLGLKEYILAGKPAFIYDKNPDKYNKAKPFTQLTWVEYRKIIPSSWKPGEHFPIDPIAAQFSSKKSLRAIVVDGRNLDNLKNLVDGKNFEGTIVF